MATVAQLAYELSLRALDQQEASLRELRARTGTLLAASSLTASFLGAPALQGGLTVPVALALVAFAAVVVFSLTTLLSRRDSYSRSTPRWSIDSSRDATVTTPTAASRTGSSRYVPPISR